MTSSTSSQLSSMFACQLQMHQKPFKPRRLLSRKVGQICYRTVNFRVCFGPKSKPDSARNTWVLSAGLLDQAHEQLKEAVYLYGRVCDDLEPEACYCHSLLAKVAFLQGKAAEVLLQYSIAAWTHLSIVPVPLLWFSYQTSYSQRAFHMFSYANRSGTSNICS